jgi:hypothetical protein
MNEFLNPYSEKLPPLVTGVMAEFGYRLEESTYHPECFGNISLTYVGPKPGMDFLFFTDRTDLFLDVRPRHRAGWYDSVKIVREAHKKGLECPWLSAENVEDWKERLRGKIRFLIKNEPNIRFSFWGHSTEWK